MLLVVLFFQVLLYLFLQVPLWISIRVWTERTSQRTLVFLWQWRTSLLSSCFACYSPSSCYPFAYRLSPACSHHLQPGGLPALSFHCPFPETKDFRTSIIGFWDKGLISLGVDPLWFILVRVCSGYTFSRASWQQDRWIWNSTLWLWLLPDEGVVRTC
jgi:hypothetical protein